MERKSGNLDLAGSWGITALIGTLAVLIWSLATVPAVAAEGDPFAVDFDHAGLVIGVDSGSDLREMILTPETTDENDEPLGPLEVRGTYTGDQDEFEVPVSGFGFPSFIVPIRGIAITGDLDLTETATGTFDPATGAMELDAKLALTLSYPEISDMPEPVGSLGTGPLECRFGPLDLNLTTDPVNWPAPGQAFTDAEGLTDGAIAGGWNLKPQLTSVSGAAVCQVLHGLINSIGGVYLANSPTLITEIPEPTGTEPVPVPCPAGTTGTPGEPDTCKVPEQPKPPVCPAGTTGTPPNCMTPPAPRGEARIGKVTVAPAKATIKPGMSVRLKVKITNGGDAAADGLSLTLKSSNGKVKVPAKVTVSVPAGSTVTRKVTVKAKRNAKGKAIVTASAAGQKGKATLIVKKPKQRKP